MEELIPVLAREMEGNMRIPTTKIFVGKPRFCGNGGMGKMKNGKCNTTLYWFILFVHMADNMRMDGYFNARRIHYSSAGGSTLSEIASGPP